MGENSIFPPPALSLSLNMHYQFVIMFSTLFITNELQSMKVRAETVIRIVETDVPLEHKSVYVSCLQRIPWAAA
jgi:hypothetical protein